jgi:DNA-binding XRE family transcriptional regulator
MSESVNELEIDPSLSRGLSRRAGLERPQTSPFHSSALGLLQYRLAIVPCAIDDKIPLIRGWSKRKRCLGQKTIRKLQMQFPEANIGICCDLSGVTVVDVDGDGELVAKAIELFGDTPLKVQTPSGGMHLYFQNNGESCENLRNNHGLEIDIKARGGLVLVPPSIRIDGEHAGQRYEFVVGSWEDLRDLPQMRYLSPKQARKVPPKRPREPMPLGSVQLGRRNDTLFQILLREAPHVDDWAALIDVARTLNDSFPDPLSSAEVEKTAWSAWGYECRGENWIGQQAKISITPDELDQLGGNANALMLLLHLRRAHGGRSEPFAISPRAMAQSKVISGWGWKKYANAIRDLTEIGVLEMVYQGGKGPGDAHQFLLRSHVNAKGPEKGMNITKHPLPSLSSPCSDIDLLDGTRRPRRIDPEIFGQKVREHRLKRSLSQEDLGTMAEMSRSSISRIETGTRSMEPQKLQVLAGLLGIDMEVAA